MADDVKVRDVPDERAFVAEIDDARAGTAVYRLAPGRITFVHTEVDPAFGGRGVGGALVRAALDDAVARGLVVVPSCPFVAGWIRKHPEYLEHVDPEHRAALAPPS